MVRLLSISCQSLKEASLKIRTAAMMPGAMGQPAPPSPTPTRRPGAASGATPAAKRPMTLEAAMNSAREFGPVMQDPEELNRFVRTLYFDIEAMKKWGFTSNAALDDHAKRLDHLMHPKACSTDGYPNLASVAQTSIASMTQELEPVKIQAVETVADLERTKNDVKEVFKKAEENDASLKAILNAFSEEMAKELGNMKSSDVQRMKLVDCLLYTSPSPRDS